MSNYVIVENGGDPAAAEALLLEVLRLRAIEALAYAVAHAETHPGLEEALTELHKAYGI